MRKLHSKYKYTGISWAAEIPEHWRLIRAKHVFKVIDDKTAKGDEELLSVSEHHGVIPRKDANVNTFKAESYEGYKLCKKRDLVINSLWAWSCGLGVSEYEGIVSNAYSVYRLKIDANHRFFNYLLRTKGYVGEYFIRSKGIWISRLQLSDLQFLDIPIVLPPEEEQTSIVNYLDSKNEKINKFISNKKKLIDLLKEQRQCIINEAVTKGINQNAKTKPSNSDWLGNVPKHWEVKKLRFVGNCQNGMNKDGEFFGSGFPFMSYGDVYKHESLPSTLSGLAESTLADRKSYSVLEGDVFFTRTSETIEEIGFASTCTQSISDATFSGFLIRFRPRLNILLPEFSKYYFRSNLIRKAFIKDMNIITRASLSQNLVKNLPVLIPPISEQQEIVNHIQSETKRIDIAISRIETEIEKVKELKQSLIAEVVTGKIKIV